MRLSLALSIAARYTRAKRRNHFISFISLTSLLGIALGVCVLITVLSVMNGFTKEVQERILKMTPHVTLMEAGGLLRDWPMIDADLRRLPAVKGVAPFIEGQGMLMRAGRLQGVLTRGILPEQVDEVFPLSSVMVAGELSNLKANFGVVLGYPTAQALGVGLGDKVTLAIPEATVSLTGVSPRLRQLEVVGIFESGYLYDSSHVFLHLDDMAKLYRLTDGVSGLQCQLHNPFQAPRVAQSIVDDLGPRFIAESWTARHFQYFQAVQMEKTMMFFILVLIIAVAAFNLVSTLVMMVTDKTSDIAILRTMGASRGQIMRIFIWQGALVGLLGTLLGTLSGIWLATHVTSVSNAIEQLLGRKLISADIYFLDYLPSQFLWSDAITVCMVSLVLSLLATLYPAWRAASLNPTEGLRYG